MQHLRSSCYPPTLVLGTTEATKQSSLDDAVVTQALAFCTDALKYVAQRLHAQVTIAGDEASVDLDATQTQATGIAAALLAALGGHPGDGDVVRECRGKALLSLAALPRTVWGNDGALVKSRQPASFVVQQAAIIL